jgi:hypothetical protein
VTQALASLERIRRRRPARAGEEERCDLCAVPIEPGHRHLVDVQARSLRCACRACALLFEHPGAGLRYRLVPDRWAGPFPVGEALSAGLEIPVGVAFVMVSSATGEASAFYPGPAGATESMLAMGAWEEFAASTPGLAGLQPDVEAALIAGEECFVVPVDACYELVGLLRRTWRGFDGGEEAREALDAFMEKVRARA